MKLISYKDSEPFVKMYSAGSLMDWSFVCVRRTWFFKKIPIWQKTYVIEDGIVEYFYPKKKI